MDKKIFLLMIMIGILILGSCSSSETDDVSKIKNAWRKYESTVKEEDVDRWLSLWIEDGVRMPPDAPRSIGLSEIRDSVEPGFEAMDFEDFVINPDEIRILSDQAYSYGLYSYSMTPKTGGDTLKFEGKFLTVFEKQEDGSWKIALDCFNFNGPPE
jgi:uncharacterized protein (TIGR02246 family)